MGGERMFIELIDQKDSGFIMEGTENTPNPVRLMAPGRRVIPNIGKRWAERIDIDLNTNKPRLDDKGKPIKIRFQETIRYIKGEQELSLQKQKEKGIEPAKMHSEDKIVIEKGWQVVDREDDPGKYDYLKEVFYNTSNPSRSQKADGLYRVVEKDKMAETDTINDLLLAEAIDWVGKLQFKEGSTYRYREDKIDAACTLLSIPGESPAIKIKNLMTRAKADPEKFLKDVTAFEQVALTEVSHALQLSVIVIKDNNISYAVDGKVIKVLDKEGTKALDKDDAMQRFAEWLKTRDGYEAYNELTAKLEAAKNSQLTK